MGCCALDGKIHYIPNENKSCVNITSKCFEENQNDHNEFTTIITGYRSSLKSNFPCSSFKKIDKQKSCFDRFSNPLPGIVNVIPRKNRNSNTLKL